jgi:hypothetical protein
MMGLFVVACPGECGPVIMMGLFGTAPLHILQLCSTNSTMEFWEFGEPSSCLARKLTPTPETQGFSVKSLIYPR